MSAQRYPALETWRAELARGERAPGVIDALYRAACYEANAIEFAHIPELHDGFMADARRIVQQALREQRQNG